MPGPRQEPDPGDEVVVDRAQVLGEGQKPPVGQQRDRLHAFVAPGVSDRGWKGERPRYAAQSRVAVPGLDVEHDPVMALEADQKAAPRKILELFGVAPLPGDRIAVVVAQPAHSGGSETGHRAARIRPQLTGQPVTLVGDRGETAAVDRQAGETAEVLAVGGQVQAGPVEQAADADGAVTVERHRLGMDRDGSAGIGAGGNGDDLWHQHRRDGEDQATG